MTISIGIMAFNEEKNIGKLLEALASQRLDDVTIKEIIVISSGSTDKTDAIVAKYAKKDKRLHHITQKKRLGKASAVNIFLKKAGSPILVLMSADLLPNPNTLNELLKPLRYESVGIVGGHPVPVNDKATFMGYVSHLMWQLHHHISLKSPKMGEMIAFRKLFKRIPVLSAVDEANIEPLIRGQGYEAVYAPKAIVRNKGPETISEFIARRRHIAAGHSSVKHEYSYSVSTLSWFKILQALFKNIELSRRFFVYTPIIVALEIYARFLGYLDYKLKLKSHTVWQTTPSTKDLAQKYEN